MNAFESADPLFEPPGMLVSLQHILAIIREEYTTDFTALLLGDKEQKEAYQNGLIFLSCMVLGFFVTWSLVLFVLKCNSASVGCAAGNRFLPSIPENPDMTGSDMSSSSSFEEPELTKEQPISPESQGSEARSVQSFFSSLPSEGEDDVSREECYYEDATIESLAIEPSLRERRTQWTFLFFAILTLACVPIVHILVFIPLRHAANRADAHVNAVRDVLLEIRTSLSSVATGTQNSLNLLDILPRTETEVCPGVNSADIESTIGFRLESMIRVYTADYSIMESDVLQMIDGVEEITRYISDGIDIVEKSATQAKNHIWLVPGFLLASLAITLIAAFGVFVALKRDSNPRLQRFLAVVALPCLIAVSVIAWLLAAGAGVVTAIGTDGCLSGSADGSPAATVSSALAAKGVPNDSVLFALITSYTQGCQGTDPSVLISGLKRDVSGVEETIWQYLTAIDNIGRSRIMEMCGEGNQIARFLLTFRDLAKQMVSVGRALDSVSVSLTCSRISVIYEDIVNQEICHEAAGAFSVGFVVFFMIGMTTMIMISLRASWYQEIDEDKIYDESEVAENMIVDEHEEYLAYISKYKHEWEEYGGFNTSLEQQPTMPVGESRGSSSGATYEIDGNTTSSSQGSINEQYCVSRLPRSGPAHDEAFDPYNSDSRSHSSVVSEEISFISLTDARISSTSQSENYRARIIDAPASLLEQKKSSDTEENCLPPPMPPPAIARITHTSPRRTSDQAPNPLDQRCTSICRREHEASSLNAGEDKERKLLVENTIQNHVRSCSKSPSSSYRRILTDLDEIETLISEQEESLVSTTGEPITITLPRTENAREGHVLPLGVGSERVRVLTSK